MTNELTPSIRPPAARTHPVMPPHPLDASWNMLVDGEIYGPFTGRQLQDFVKEGRLDSGTEVCRIGGANWIPARDDKALARFFDDEKPPVRRPKLQVDAASISSGERNTIVNVTNTVNAHPPISLEAGDDKSPGLALLLSLLLVGVGQFYNGDVGKGFLMIVLCVLLWMVLLGWIIQVWSIIDAYSTAKRKRAIWRRHYSMAPA